MSCQILEAQVNGWRAVRLLNSEVAITVLPDKGADIYEFIDRASGIDVLMKTPQGLQPPGAPPTPGSGEHQFLHNYEGAWQELFPNTGPPCTHEGRQIPLHGEVCTLPWTITVERDDAELASIKLVVECRRLPLLLTRRMIVTRASPVLSIQETVRNLSDRTVTFVWGHHPVLGAPFLEDGCRMSVGRCVAHTPDPPFDPANASYAPGQRSQWPYIQSIGGKQVDLRTIPGPEANTHDHACLTDLERGWMEIENPRLGLAFSLEWNQKVFRWINNWRPFGGSHSPPLEGIYGIALEPWASRTNLANAVREGTALSLDGGQTLETSLHATLRSTRAGTSK